MKRPAPIAASLARRPLSRVLRLLFSLALFALPLFARAQSKSDAFAGKIPPVSAGLYRKAERFEATASANLSLDDPFYSKYFLGLKLGYHFTEAWSAHAFLSGGLDAKSGSAQVCPSNGGCHAASNAEMYQVPGNIRLLSGVEGAWAPIYGKLNIFSEKVGHFDMSLIGGLDWVNYRKVLSGADATAGVHPGSRSTLGVHGGLGVRVFLSEAIAARLEIRDYVYRVSVPNWPENGGAKRDLQNQLFAEIGLSFFFPTGNRPLQ